MKNHSEKHIEQLFNDAFSGHEAEFDPKAWDHMKELLDKEDNRPAVIVPPQKHNNQSNLSTILIVMSTLGILSLCGWFIFNAETNPFGTNIQAGTATAAETGPATNETVKAGTSQEQSVIGFAEESKPLSGMHENQMQSGKSQAAAGKNIGLNAAGSVNGKPEYLHSNKVNEETSAEQADQIAESKDSSVTEIRNEKEYRIVTRKVWVPETYETVETESSRFNDRGFIGIHVTTENKRGLNTLSGGFNLQGMSGNILNHKFLALHAGFDWGMQFYGSGLRNNVALNTDRSDSGYSIIQNYSTDLVGRLHLEFGASQLVVPYLNLMAGPRIYTASQVIKSYRNSTEYENSTSHNMHSSVSMLLGVGAGLRFRLSHTVSLDFRYEYINGTSVKRVDMNNTSFNGLNYNKKLYTDKPRLEQFKIGLLFNLTSREYEEKISKEGYMKVVSVDSIFISEKDSNVIYLPCPCISDCDKKGTGKGSGQTQAPKPVKSNPSEQESPYIYREDDSSNRDRNNNNGGSNGGGSTKKSFPGVKPPSRPTESGGTR